MCMHFLCTQETHPSQFIVPAPHDRSQTVHGNAIILSLSWHYHVLLELIVNNPVVLTSAYTAILNDVMQ